MKAPLLQPAAGVAAPGESEDGRSIDAPAQVVVEERKSKVALPAATPAAALQGRKKNDR